jgi:hypothetical protein
MAPVALRVILCSGFVVALLLRKPLEKHAVLSAVETAQARRRFAVDLACCLPAGI